MRNVMKTSTLESKFPLLSVENDCIISKDADITVAYRMELPELFTIAPQEYEAMHAAWVKAVKVLPEYSIVCKQDWFTAEKYAPDTDRQEAGFLSRSYERHFNERPYLNHACYLYLTKTTRERARQQSLFSSLCRGFIIPKEVSEETAVKFLEAVEQFERIMNDSGCVRVHRLTNDEITGTPETPGLIEKYFSLSHEAACLEDIAMGAHGFRIGSKHVCLHTLSDTDDLPAKVGTDMRYEKLSTDRSDCRLSFAAPVGLLLSCDHIYSQYLFVDDSAESLRRFEKQARNMHSLSRYSRANQINKQWIDLYLNEAHSYGLTSVRAHFNVMAWSEDERDLKRIRSEAGSRLAQMGCKPRHNTVDAPTLFWAGIPGNAGDFPAEESFYTFIEPALCLFAGETNYKSSLSPFGIKLSDRISGKPVHVDISDEPMQRGVTNNAHKFILGPSGSGKSFFTNHLVRSYYEQGAHIIIVDMGNSYQGLFELIRSRTGGADGVYFTYTADNPISFNPFHTDDLVYDGDKIESLKTLILTLWKRGGEGVAPSEEVAVSNAVSRYVKLIKSKKVKPSFNTFYDYMQKNFRRDMKREKVREKEFDLQNFLYVLAPFYKDGEYGYLLNSEKGIDLLHKRAICFEIDGLKDNKVLFPVVTLVIMEAYLSKMFRLKGERKVMIQEEAWKAISKGEMASFLKYLYKTARKYFGEIITVTQEVDDIIASPVVKESIIMNSDCKILLDQRKYINKFDSIQSLLGLTDKQKAQILSINMANDPTRKYREVWIGLGSTHSAVYATEVSQEENYAFTTQETEKLEVMRLAEKLGGDMEAAIRRLAEAKKDHSNTKTRKP